MIDGLAALSLYRQLEALEKNLSNVKDDYVDQFMAAYTNQMSFNHILKQITEQCGDAPEYLKSFSHIEPAAIPKGAKRYVYQRFLAKVQMLKQAVGTVIELTLSSEQKREVGFR
jgi:hypothetical protein